MEEGSGTLDRVIQLLYNPGSLLTEKPRQDSSKKPQVLQSQEWGETEGGREERSLNSQACVCHSVWLFPQPHVHRNNSRR